jgi:DNA invertase Pin-like site-specific DNA recombinase
MVTYAYSYIRFSSEKQHQGDSLRRQTDAAQKYADEHNLHLDNKSYMDLGISAFKGKNFIEGKLSLFLEAVEQNKIPKGSFLLVESIDRLSRETVDIALELFLRIIRNGVTIVTLINRQVFSQESVRDNWTQLIISIAEMARAHQESLQKSKRVGAAWEAIRNGEGKHQRKIITKMCPAWLSVVDDEWVIDQEKVKTIRRIFDLAMAGNGSPRIMRMLNADKTATFGSGKRKAIDWTAGTVAHVLSNKAVIGIYETKMIHAREGYFPEVIPRKLFLDVQSAMRSRNFAPSGRGDSGVANLFAGRSFCGVCGAKMKTVSSTKGLVYIHCETAYSNKGCSARRVAYTAFEEDVLRWIEEKDRNVFKEISKIDVDVRPAIQAEIEMKQKEIEKLVDILLDSPKSKVLNQRLTTAEIEISELQEQLSKALPPTTTNDAELVDLLYETYTYYYNLRDMLLSGSNHYGYIKDHRELVYSEKSERAVKNLERHERFVTEFGDHYEIDEKTLAAIKVRFNDLRKEIQVGLRRLIKRVDLHHLASKNTRPEMGSFQKLKNATYESYKITFSSGGIFERWYMRPPKGFQKGNRNGKSVG